MKQLSYPLIVKFGIILLTLPLIIACSESPNDKVEIVEEDPEKKIQLLTEALENAKDNAEKVDVMDQRAKLYVDLGQSDRALDDYFEILKFCDSDEVAFYKNEIGNCYYDIDSLEQAVSFYQSALRLDPEDGTIVQNIGSVYFDLGNNKEAERYFSIFFEQGLQDSITRLQRAVCYTRLNEYQKALKDYQYHNDNYQTTQFVLHGIGKVYANLGNNLLAIKHFTEAIKLDSTNQTRILIDRGLSYLYNQQKTEAFKDLNDAVALDTTVADAYTKLGFAYLYTNRPDSAQYFLNIGIDKGADGYAYYYRAESHAQVGNNELACIDYTTALGLGVAQAQEEIDKVCR